MVADMLAIGRLEGISRRARGRGGAQRGPPARSPTEDQAARDRRALQYRRRAEVSRPDPGHCSRLARPGSRQIRRMRSRTSRRSPWQRSGRSRAVRSRLPHDIGQRNRRRCRAGGSPPSCRTAALMSSTALPPKRVAEHAIEGRRRAAALQVAEHDAIASPCRSSVRAPRHTCAPTPPRRSTCPPRAASSSATSAADRLGALRDDHDAELARRAARAAGACCGDARGRYGISGMRMTSAPPATPACSAIQPA